MTTYGKIAKLVGSGARQVGYAMAATPADQGIPWHRVVNSKGEISARRLGDGGDRRQRDLLIFESVVFDKHNRIDLNRFAWIEIELPFIAEDWQELQD